MKLRLCGITSYVQFLEQVLLLLHFIRCSTLGTMKRMKLFLLLLAASSVYCANFKANLCFIPYLSFTLTLCINTIKEQDIHQKRDIHVVLSHRKFHLFYAFY